MVVLDEFPANACRRFLAERQPDWENLLAELVRIPSCFEREHAVLAFVEQYLTRLGVPFDRVAHDAARLRHLPAAQAPVSTVPGRHSLVARVPGRGTGRSLILSTHLDIVPEGPHEEWKHPPFGAVVEETPARVLFGRGAMDDKAGVAIALAVLETLVRLRLQPAGDVLFQFVLEDEVTGNGTLLCLDAGHTADAAMIIDGTRTDRAINQHAGNLQFTLRVKGRPASVSVSHLGVNAVEVLARLLLRLRETVAALNATRTAPWTRFPSPFQFVTQQLHGTGRDLTVPDAAWAQVYVTFPPPWTLAGVRRLLAQEAEAFAAELRLSDLPQLDWTGFATEPVGGPQGELEDVLAQTAAATGLGAVDVGPSTGTSDLRHFLARGIPGLLYGPGRGFNPHRPDEHYYLDDLPRMVRFYLHFIGLWCRLETTEHLQDGVCSDNTAGRGRRTQNRVPPSGFGSKPIAPP